ncbi:MAG: hypothetical protein QOJ35_3663 [Solirubrobacteraceae bacterium]|nr:hypothetical protein [Solirubrobacteraceae bacterium]
MTPRPRAALLLGGVALAALVLPLGLVALAALGLAGAAATDAWSARRRPEVTRHVAPVLSRGVVSPLTAEVEGGVGARLTLRQAAPPDLALRPQEARGDLRIDVLPRRRGRHTLPALAGRLDGPLGLSGWHHRWSGDAEVLVYPDLPAARRIALSVREGRFRDQGQRSRGPLGLGTEFESIRDYLPDDDIRQVNWPATVRLGRPMSNQYRVEQDRDVICVIDCGRLMAAPLSAGATRLDVAIDAATAVGLVADELGDRCGIVAFDATVLRRLAPRRKGGDALVRAVFDLQPSAVDSDYELALRSVASAKRALVIVFTDLIEEVAARSLVTAVPVLARRHEVVVAGVIDPDLDAALGTLPTHELDVMRAAAALDVLAARERAAARVRGAGARVLETAPSELGRACVGAYLSAKARARL